MLEALVLSFVGGMAGALLMDITETLAARRGISSGVSVALVGRWCIALAHGVLRHSDIRHAPARRYEVAAGWLFHLLLGGGGVALLLPLGWQLFTTAVLPVTPAPYLLFGLATSLLPWFVLLPSFGWGVWGRRGPEGSKALLASPLAHLSYGLGIWATVVIGTPLLTA